MFKYLDVHGAKKTLEGRAVKFARPVDFNDPFDINLEELLGADPETFSGQLREAHYNFLCGDIDFAKLMDNPHKEKIIIMNTVLKKATREKREILKKELMAVPFDKIYDRKRLKAVDRRTLIEIRNGLYGYGVFCASQRPDSLLMWAHYADRHSGIVLEFNPDMLRDSMLLAAKPVIYSQERPLLYRRAEDMVRHAYTISEEESAGDMLNRIIFTKSMEWEYEKELRLAIPKLIAEGKSFEVLQFLPNELASVTLGCRTTGSDKSEIVTLAKRVNPDVEIRQARTAKREYSLEITRVSEMQLGSSEAQI